MAEIKSNEFKVGSKASNIQEFLSNLNNIEQLMPEEKIKNWKSDNDTCSFTIKGLSGIGMKRDDSATINGIRLISHGKNPFDFTLDILILDEGDSCTSQIVFDGNMNFMIQTMAKGPLTTLFHIMGDKLVEKFN
jgi:hypothetical protein